MVITERDDIEIEEADKIVEEQTGSGEVEEKHTILKREILNNIKTIAIFGDTGSGKTALSYKIISLFESDKPIYFIKHPSPEVIEKKGYFNIKNLQQLEKLQDCIVYWDEPQLSVSIMDKKTNSIIAKVCSLARQRNIKIIISSSDTRVFTKHNEAYFDLWLIKDIDYKMVKQGSIIKQAIKDNCILDAEGFELDKNEFLAHSRTLEDYNGQYSFELLDFYDDKFSKPYYNKSLNRKMNRTKSKWDLAIANAKANEMPNEFKIKKNTTEEIIVKFRQSCRSWIHGQIEKGNFKLDKCKVCGLTYENNLYAHHKRYSYPFNFEDIEVLCGSCHHKEHANNHLSLN